MKTPPAPLAWLAWGLGAAFYLIAFYQRVAPAVMTGELSRDFALTGAALGNLSAFYFYSYVAVQVPTGLLADRFGPRVVLASGGAIMALGTLLFALASGLALLTGTLGATLAGAPLRAAVDAFGWRPVMVASAAATALVAAAIWLVVRDDPSERGYASYFPAETHAGDSPSVWAQLGEVFRYRNAWLILLIPGGYSAILLTFAGLWGVPFLVSQHGFGAREAAATASAMLIAWALGGLAYGPVSQRLGARKPVMIAGLALTLALWSLVVFVPALAPGVLVAILLALAFAAGGAVLSFPFAKESVPARLGGTVSGVANMGMMLGGMLMQPLVGVVLDRRWDGAMANGARVYDFAAYQWGFAMILAWGFVSLVLLALARETHCRPFG